MSKHLWKQKSIIDPRTKLLILFTLVFCVLYTAEVYALIGLLAISLIFLFYSKIKIKYLTLSLISVTFFSIIATLIVTYINLNTNFAIVFLIIEIRFLVTLFPMLWFFHSVKPYELAVALEKTYVPPKFVWFLTSIYQIMPMIAQEASNVNVIRKIKGLTARKFNFKSQYIVIKHTLKPMINSSINRGIDLAEAMVLKGYRGEKRKIFALNQKLKIIDYTIFLGSIVLVITTILFLGRQGVLFF